MLATEFIQELGQTLSINNLSFNDEYLCFISADSGNLDLTIETDESGRQLYICAHLGVMPDDDNAAAAVGLLFAQANGVLAATNKGVLVLDYNGQGLMLVKLYDLSSMEPVDCMTSVLQLITDGVNWKRRLQLPDFGLGGMDDTRKSPNLSGNNFLKI